MTHYMTEQLDMETIYYLLQHPSLFISQQLYYQFLEQYFPNYIQKHPVLTQALVQSLIVNNMRKQQERREQHIFELNFKRVSEEINKNHRTKKLPNNLNINVQLNNILHDTAKRMTSEHRRQLDYHLNRIQKDLDKISKDGLIKNVDIKNNPEIQKLRKKHQQQIQRQNKRIEKNKENRVKWMTERLKDKPAKYKVWQQTPNPKTRHTHTDGQKVAIEEKFIVINDKTGDIDYVDYPGDWTCSPSNKENCLCNITFTNNPTGYKPQHQLKTEYQQQAQKIKQQKQNKTKTNKQQKFHNNLLNNETKYKMDKTQLTSQNKITYKQNNVQKIIDKIDHQKPELIKFGLTQKSIQFLKDFHRNYIYNNVENGAIFNAVTGKQLYYKKGGFKSVFLDWSKISLKDNGVSIHTHTHALTPNPSGKDIYNILRNSKEHMAIVDSENEIWAMKFKGVMNERKAKKICKSIDNVTHKYEQLYWDEKDNFKKSIEQEFMNKKDQYIDEKGVFNKIKFDLDKRRVIALKNEELFKINSELINEEKMKILLENGIETMRIK